MDTKRIVAELRRERERIDKAITALESLDSGHFSTGARTARRARSAMKQRRRHYRISASGRRRISEAAKAMWAKRKKKARSRHVNAATRKRLSELAKQRWAERKKKAKIA